MAANMQLIAKRSFPNATLVTDRFHVQKLDAEALQEIRIEEDAKNQEKRYEPALLSNGDTVKQLTSIFNHTTDKVIASTNCMKR